MEPKNSSNKTVLIIIGALIAILCCCLVIFAGVGIWLYQNSDELIDVIPNVSTATPSAPIVVERPPVGEIPTDTLTIL